MKWLSLLLGMTCTLAHGMEKNSGGPCFLSLSGSAASPEELVKNLVKESSGRKLEKVEPADYPGLAEKIVRQASRWQDPESGRLLDPVLHKETSVLTIRYVGALGALMLQGRCMDLKDSCIRAMEGTLTDLVEVKTGHGEFYPKEFMMGYLALRDKVPPELRQKWETGLGMYDPEKAYGRTHSNCPRGALHNFVTFGLAGEAMKFHYGLARNQEFMYAYLKEQLARFDASGMYRDKGETHNPMVYDLTARMNLAIAEYHCQYPEPLRTELRKNLRYGALCGLLSQSPTGETPFGGRSNQQNFVEASFALTCELEARQYMRENNPAMAGILRRAAARAVHSIVPYLREEPIFYNKNLFPPETQHGRQKGYGWYGAYSVLIASQLAMASWYADKSIPMGDWTPAEDSAYLWRTERGFHKLFAAVSGTQIVFELNADPEYDANGWGRFHIKGIPAGMMLSAPCPKNPNYLTVVPPSAPLSLSPGREKDGSVAELDLSAADCRFEGKVCPDGPEFTLVWPFPSGPVTEKFRLTGGKVSLHVTKDGGDRLYYRIPVLVTDGRNWVAMPRELNRYTESGVFLDYKGFRYTVQSNAVLKLNETNICPNRNGLYRVFRLFAPKNTLELTFQAAKQP